MKILWYSTSDMTTEPIIEGLHGHEKEIFRYDRCGGPPDIQMLNAADRIRPNVIIYTGSNNPAFLAAPSTFRMLKRLAPSVLICHDTTDATWIELVREYQRRDCFSVVVNIDGNDGWDKRPGIDYTALTPTAPRFYVETLSIAGRNIDFAFAGGFSSPSRANIVNHLHTFAGLVVPPRNETYGSYGSYATFLQTVKIVLNVPWSGSDNAVQVKGRVLEAGWAGCCLIDHMSSATQHWFDSGTEWMPYESKEHAVDLVRALLLRPDKMQNLADSLARRVRAEHHADKFWSTIFERLNLKCA